MNAHEENLQQSALFLDSLPWERRKINVLPYHDIARAKYAKLESNYNPDSIVMSEPSREQQQTTDFLPDMELSPLKSLNKHLLNTILTLATYICIKFASKTA